MYCYRLYFCIVSVRNFYNALFQLRSDSIMAIAVPELVKSQSENISRGTYVRTYLKSVYVVMDL